jgi:hypothetical protein
MLILARGVLSERFKSIWLVKIIGLALLGVAILAMIIGAIARATYVWYSPDKIKNLIPVRSYNPVTREDEHSLCRVTVSNWSFLQLAALPVLSEVHQLNASDPGLLHDFANLTNIPIVTMFNSQGLLARDASDNKYAIALKSIPFDRNFAIYIENFIVDYYHVALDEVVPFYSLAYENFLGDALSAISQSLISGILGPNRLSVYHLDRAEATINLEMRTMHEVLEVLRESSGRPVVVGHGANGLLAKAVTFSYDPWRISFESPKLKDSPMATLAHSSHESATSRIVNMYTEDSFYAAYDDAALMNNRVPPYGITKVIPPDPFDTFCFAAVACGEDDRFDALCKDVLGEKEFKDLWDTLGRPRFRI